MLVSLLQCSYFNNYTQNTLSVPGSCVDQVGLEYGLADGYNYQMNLKSDYSAEIHLYNDSSLRTELQANGVGHCFHDDKEEEVYD